MGTTTGLREQVFTHVLTDRQRLHVLKQINEMVGEDAAEGQYISSIDFGQMILDAQKV